MQSLLFFNFYRCHLLTSLNLQWSFSALPNDKALWSLSILSFFWLKRAWSENSSPSLSHLNLAEAACVAVLRQGLWSLSEVSGSYQLHDGSGTSLVINWPDGTETPQMGKNKDPWCEKADRVSQPWKFSQCTRIQTSCLNQSGLHTHCDINDLSNGVLVSLTSLVFCDGAGQCSLSISVFKHETYQCVITVRTDFMFCQVTVFNKSFGTFYSCCSNPQNDPFFVSLYCCYLWCWFCGQDFFFF